MRRIRFTIVGENASADAELLTGQAPQTADAVWRILPVAGRAHHAVYSGSEGVLILPEVLRIPPEAATADVTAGDVGFTWFDAGSSHGVTEAFAEVCWFYDNDARPSMHEGPAPVSIFARFVGDTRDFYAACRRMRREGTKAMVIERVEDEERPLRHSLVYRDDFGHISSPRLSRASDGMITAQFIRHAYRPDSIEHSWLSDIDLTLQIESRVGGESWGARRIVEPFLTTEAEGFAPLLLKDGRQLTAEWVNVGGNCIALEATLTQDEAGVPVTELIRLRYLPKSDISNTWQPALIETVPGQILCLYVVDEGAPDGGPPGGVCALHATMFSV